MLMLQTIIRVGFFYKSRTKHQRVYSSQYINITDLALIISMFEVLGNVTSEFNGFLNNGMISS